MIIEWNDDKVIQKIKEAAAEASKKGAEIVAEAAKRLVPVETGTLKGSIRAVKSKFGDDYLVIASSTRWRKTSSRSGAMAAVLDYAPFVEMGTARNPKKPYLRPALYNNHRRIYRLYKEILS